MPDGEIFNAASAVTTAPSPCMETGKVKDPKRIARKYQLELCNKALKDNIIVYLGTGSGKTHIAVLLIDEMSHFIKKPQSKICIFLAPTNALVEQQGRVIEDSIDFKVRVFCGSSNPLKSHQDWHKVIQEYEIFVMTPQLLLRALYHCFIKMETIALLIFDECHHAQVQTNHPYAAIMKIFYKGMTGERPRVFGMTASPVVGKGASCPGDLPKLINSLEYLLDAKVYSVDDTEELEKFVSSALVKVYHYDGLSVNGTYSYYLSYEEKLEDLKKQCISMLGGTKGDHQSLRSTKKLLARVHDNMLFCLENLGLRGTLHASRILLTGDHSEITELVEAEESYTYDLLCDRYLKQVAEILASDCIKDKPESDLSCIEVLKQPFLSSKLLCLIKILSTFRIVTARSLSFILQNLTFLKSWKCDFLVGIHAGLKNMTRETMNDVLEKFRSGKLNLLVATKVGEEGLDIQTCCLVIRFDFPETVSSFIQSRGRARMPRSEYAFLVDSGKEKEINLIDIFKNGENHMNVEISNRSSTEIFNGFEERIYRVYSTGASISSGYSVSVLHHYCSTLPHDEYFEPKPKFSYFDDKVGAVCKIILPSNAALHQVVSEPHPSMKAAKKDACLRAVEELHKVGALTDYLLPQQGDADGMAMSDDDIAEDESPRELHETLVPATLKEPWNNMGDSIHLSSYFIEFLPVPEDRVYKRFGLFIKAPLPQESEGMELDLHLAHGRYVTSKLIPAGVKIFDNEEMLLAQHFHEMCLKAILDRGELIPDCVPLGKKNDYDTSRSTFYLLLPVISNDYLNIMSVDWELVRRCLSSPMFRNLAMAKDKQDFPSEGQLQLGNGCWSINDIENSFVYCPHKQAFLFVTNVVHEANSYGLYKDSGTISHMDYYYQTYGKHLKHPEQPLLRAKQLFHLNNLLKNRRGEDAAESSKLDEHLADLPPELLELKILGFSKDIGSSLSLLPSFMHHLEGLLMAIELKQNLRATFPGAAQVTAHRVLEALTTEKCLERFSLERLETLGDSFLKFVVGRHFFLQHDCLDEGQLSKKRSNAVCNSNLVKLATKNNLQVYIRDKCFEPSQFFAFGRPCPTICNKETEYTLHHRCDDDDDNANEIACSKGHRWLYKKTIADVVEALIGAFLVDGGFKAATEFLRWIGIPVNFEASQVTSACLESKSFMSLAENMDVTSLEKLLGYQFRHKGLLLQAFLHPSYDKHGGGCYQRLEFLGDAVLDYLITSYIFSVYPKLRPGDLTDLRSASVSNKAFATVATDRFFHKYLLYESDALARAINDYVNFIKTSSPQSAISAGPKCPKALGDVVESCMGAILLDTGFDLDHVWELMLSFLDPSKAFSSLQLNPIRDLHELCQSHGLELEFSASKVDRNFLVKAEVNGKNSSTTTSASDQSKKGATKMASHQMYDKLKARGFAPKLKSLEERLKSTRKDKAILIGYNETPIDVTFSESTKIPESNQETFQINDVAYSCTPTVVPVSRPLQFLPVCKVEQLSQTVPSKNEIDSQTKGLFIVLALLHLNCVAIVSFSAHVLGVPHYKTAKQRLHEFCVANCWNRPVFEVFKEEGPSHQKSFTCKVILEITESPEKLFECIGSPHLKKKAAEESVAEGMLWQLEILGYLRKYAVLGAGFAGLSVTWHLLNHSPRETHLCLDLYDEAGIGGGASGVAGGLLHPYSPKVKLVWQGAECWKESLKLLRIAETAIQTQSDINPKEFLVRRRGILRPATNSKTLNILTQNAQDCLHSCKIDTIDSNTAQSLVPNLAVPLNSAFYMPEAVNVNSRRYLEALFLACENFVKESSDGRKEIHLRKKSICKLLDLEGDYDAVIICMGAKAKELPELSERLPLRTCRGVITHLQLPDDKSEAYSDNSPSILSDAWLAIQGTHSLYMGSTWNWNSTNSSQHVSKEEADAALHELLPKASKVYPNIENWACVDAKAGLRAMPPLTAHGSLPLLGCVDDFLRKSSNCKYWLFGGLGSRGLLYHAWLGKLMAKAVVDCNEGLLPSELTCWKSLNQ
ncbi:hypothetical protein ACFE04_000855 [Oxalis oulophora]